jgi:hypothetical protein
MEENLQQYQERNKVQKILYKSPTTWIIGIMTIVVSVTLWSVSLVLKKKESPRKALESVCIAQISLVDINNEFRDKLTIMYANRIVQNLSKITFQVRNSGTDVIRASEISEMPYFKFPSGMDVFDVKIVNRTPEDLYCNINYIDSLAIAILDLKLLNPDDQFKIDIYYTGNFDELPVLKGRIENIKKITNLTKTVSREKPQYSKILLSKILASIFCLLLSFIGILFIIASLQEAKQIKMVVIKNLKEALKLLEAMKDPVRIDDVKMYNLVELQERFGQHAEVEKFKIRNIMTKELKKFQNYKRKNVFKVVPFSISLLIVLYFAYLIWF